MRGCRSLFAAMFMAGVVWLGQCMTFAQMQHCLAPPSTVSFLFQSSSPPSLSDFNVLNCGTGGADCVISSTVQYAGVNTLQIHYGPATAPVDSNRSVVATYSAQQGWVYAKMSFYFHMNAGGTSQDQYNQRKLLRMGDGNGGTYHYQIIADSWYNTVTGKMDLSVTDNAASPCTQFQDYSLFAFDFDTWYDLELGFLPDTTGSGTSGNGAYRVWVNGVEKTPSGKHETTACVRGAITNGNDTTTFGNQSDSVNTNVDEYRYLYGMKVATSQIP